MSTIPTKRAHTPYVYLALTGQGAYNLFLAIPCDAGEKVDNVQVVYTNGSTQVTGEIATDQNQSAGLRALKLSLTPAAAAQQANPSYAFEEDQFEVNITITHLDSTIRRTILMYTDADPLGPESAWVQNDFAYNCPYLYLNNPQDQNSPSQRFAPRVILFLDGHKLKSHHLLLTSADPGLCEQTVVVYPDQNVDQQDISDDLDVNNLGLEYFDNGEIEGSFFTFVLIADDEQAAADLADQVARNEATFQAQGQNGNKPRKARFKLVNQSADANPNIFI